MLAAYLFTLIMTIPFLILLNMMNERYGKKGKYTLVFMYVLVVFVVITGLRDTASISIENNRQSDEFTYRKSFEMLIETPFSLSSISSFEWGRYLLDWSLANLFGSSQVWVFTYALLTNLFYLQAIKKYVNPFWFGVFLYITIGLYTFQMNGTTSVLASAILLKGIDYIVERRFWRFLLVVFFAGGIHFSAWVMLPLYFVLYRRNLTKGTPLWLGASVIFMLGFNSIANVILPNTPYYHYLTQINSSSLYGVNTSRILIFIALYFSMLYMFKNIKNPGGIDYYFNNTLLILISINIASSVYVYIYRFNEIFAFALIYILPRVVYSYPKSVRNILVLLFTVAFFCFGLQQNWGILYRNILFY